MREISSQSSYVKKMVYASLFAALTAIGAWITIPLGIVPITLQTLFVILAGAVLGAYFGALSMIVYVLLGLIGLPVYAGGQSGFGALAGPVGGYLTGFVLCALVVGFLVDMKKSPGFLWYCITMAVGTLIIYLCGVTQLIIVTHMTLENALIVGVLPFIPGDTVKIVIASLIARRIGEI